MNKSNRQTKREIEKGKRTRRKILLYSGLGLAIIVIIIVIISVSANSPNTISLMGDSVPILSTNHVSADTDPGPYNSNPPSGGQHFETPFEAKFFQESDLSTIPKHPEGYLVHSLEHGYVIFWYNCQVANTDCAQLKQTIQKVMDETGNTKLIAFPWSNMDVPLAMTSWGRIKYFLTIDPALMKQFVQRNRYQAPEPDGA